MLDSIVYIERSKAETIRTDSLKSDLEYHVCDKINENGIYINDYDYYFQIDHKYIYAYVEESVGLKFWDHDYISPKLHIKSIEIAASSHKMVEKVIKESFEPNMIIITYTLKLKREDNESSVKNIIDRIEQLIDEVRHEAHIVSKRELLHYINKQSK